MSERWHKDPTTGEQYREFRQNGKFIRETRVARDSSRNRGQPSSSRRDEPTQRRRRDSVVSSGSYDTKPPSRGQRDPSSKRDPSNIPEDDKRIIEHSKDRYTNEDRGYGRQDVLAPPCGERQTHSSYRESERAYHPPGGYASQQVFATQDVDPADDMTRGMRSLSTDDSYMPQPPTSSLLTSLEYTTPSRYIAYDSTQIDAGQGTGSQPTQASRAPTRPRREIKGTFGQSETLDPSYYVRNHDYKKFFRVGRVFATLWTEGAGSNANLEQTFVSEVAFKERVYTKVRRFVVVRDGTGYATCLPVTSYGGQGHKKPKIRLEEHGFIHSKNPPKKVDKMQKKSLKVLLSSSRVKDFEDPSLVNYRKVYTVETNVKVKDIGQLDSDSKGVLERYFKKIFNDEADVSDGIDDTPRQSNAALVTAHVGGAIYDAPSVTEYNTTPSAAEYSLYSSPTSQGVAGGWPSSTHGLPNPSGYATTQGTQPTGYNTAYQSFQQPNSGSRHSTHSDRQLSRVNEHPQYQNQTGTVYPATGTGSGYTSGATYVYAATADATYNTTSSYYPLTPAYPPPETGYNTITSGPIGTAQYGTTSQVATTSNYTPRTSPAHAISGDIYSQRGGGQITSSRDDYYGTYPPSSNPQPAYQSSGIDDGEEEIKLPTLEEETRRRRESNAGSSRPDRRRRR